MRKVNKKKEYVDPKKHLVVALPRHGAGGKRMLSMGYS